MFVGFDILFTFSFLFFLFASQFLFNFMPVFHVWLFYFLSFVNSFTLFVFWLTAFAALFCPLSISFHIFTRMILPFLCAFSRLAFIKLFLILLSKSFLSGNKRLRRADFHDFLNYRIFVNILTKTESKIKLIFPIVSVRVTVFDKRKQDCHFPHI